MTPPDSDATNLPCPHGRPSWRMCPHCLDLGGTTLSVAAHIVASPILTGKHDSNEVSRTVILLRGEVVLPLSLAQRILAALEASSRNVHNPITEIEIANELRAVIGK